MSTDLTITTTTDERANPRPKRRMGTIPEGTRFGALTVLNKIPGTGIALYNVRCDCGREKSVHAIYLHIGKTKSCGMGGVCSPQRKHGEYGSPEYRVWRGMLQRCLNTKHTFYHHYGGRGITVCERWKTFAGFFEDMGRRPSLRYKLERINNDGHYSPENCKWATQTEQSRNTRVNRFLIYKGERKTVAEWSEILGIGRSLIYGRIKRGWQTNRIFTEPARNNGNRKRAS